MLENIRNSMCCKGVKDVTTEDVSVVVVVNVPFHIAYSYLFETINNLHYRIL